MLAMLKKRRTYLSPMRAVCAFMLLMACGTQLAHAELKTTYYHTDGLGSVVAASDENGALLWRKDYAPFGAQLDSTTENEKLAYTGKEHDETTGLTYFGARYYDPQLGRFVSVDPVGFVESNPMSFNRYAYANSNPYRFVDPDGRQSQDASCDEACEYDLQRQRGARGARIFSQGASDLADVADQEASSPWNWIPFIGGAKKIERAALWTSTKRKTAAENALRHFKDHGADFGAQNAVDYVKRAQNFLRSPPAGTLTRLRANGDVVATTLGRTRSASWTPTALHEHSLSPILNRCRVCGLHFEDPPWGLDGQTPLYEHCPCCGVEFGYQDATPEAAKKFRGAWLSAGANWDDSVKKPPNWNPMEQLEHIPMKFR